MISDYPAMSLFNLYLFGGRSPAYIQYDIEVRTATCMESQGWTYLVPPVPVSSAPASFDMLKSYRAQFGYGIASGEPELDGFGNDELNAASQANLAIQRSLSDSARLRYLAALVGDEVEGQPVPTEGPVSCRAAATAAATAQVPFYESEFASAPQQFLDALAADARFVAAVAAWATCMKVDGYQVVGLDDPSGSLHEQYMSVDNEEERAQFAVRELSMARADVKCYEDHVLVTRGLVEAEIIAEMVESGRLPPLPGGDGQ